jgi:hypothetical protein
MFYEIKLLTLGMSRGTPSLFPPGTSTLLIGGSHADRVYGTVGFF